MARYQVTVTTTKVSIYEVEAPSEGEAGLNYEGGELVSEDTQTEVSEVSPFFGVFVCLYSVPTGMSVPTVVS